jgi:hypothetical protein
VIGNGEPLSIAISKSDSARAVPFAREPNKYIFAWGKNISIINKVNYHRNHIFL